MGDHNKFKKFISVLISMHRSPNIEKLKDYYQHIKKILSKIDEEHLDRDAEEILES